MPKKSWASEKQQTWLLAQLADFRQAQEAKTTPSFFTELYQKFHDEWPLASPDADEISKADGNEEKARTVKQKASEHVGGSFTVKYSVALIQYTY
jgi:predicted metal-dependent hydrolase